MKKGFWARFSQIVGAWSFLTVFNFLFDSVAYPLAIWKFGPICGGGTMAVIAIAICYWMMLGYEKSGKDWLGVNVVESIKVDGSRWVNKLDIKSKLNLLWWLLRLMLWVPSRSFLVVLWMIRKNDVLAFLALTFYQDPFITTVFLRHGRFDGLKKKDWLIFSLSAILANGYWIIRNVVLVEALRFGYRMIV